jgi:hypothetical protein
LLLGKVKGQSSKLQILSVKALLSAELCFDASSQLKVEKKKRKNLLRRIFQPVLNSRIAQRIFMKFIIGEFFLNLSNVSVLVQIRK